MIDHSILDIKEMATIYCFFLKLHDVNVENLFHKLESVLMRIHFISASLNLWINII